MLAFAFVVVVAVVHNSPKLVQNLRTQETHPHCVVLSVCPSLCPLCLRLPLSLSLALIPVHSLLLLLFSCASEAVPFSFRFWLCVLVCLVVVVVVWVSFCPLEVALCALHLCVSCCSRLQTAFV